MPSGDWTKRFSAGDGWQPRADWLNNVTRTAEDHLRSLGSQGGDSAPDLPPEGLVMVQNGSAADVGRFAILGLNGVVIEPSQNLPQFQATPLFFGDTPNTGDTFVVCAEPIAKGKSGMAFIAGVSAVQINIHSTNDEFADLIDGDGTKLQSRSIGSAKIIYSEAGTGTKWAVVQLAIGTPGYFPVDLTKDGGDDGDASTAPSYTYTASKDGVSLGIGLSPEKGRQIGSFVPATEGRAYYKAGVLTLDSADEKENTVVCGT